MSITKKENGTYEVRVVIRSKLGGGLIYRRKSGIVGPKKAKQIEEAIRAEMLAEDRRHPKAKWGRIVEEFLASPLTKAELAENTLYRYEKTLSHADVWDEMEVAKITEADIINLIETLSVEYNWSAGNRQYLKKALSAVFRYAVKVGVVLKNPCENIKFKTKSPDLNIWTLEQYEQFLAYVFEIDKEWYYIFALAGLTGCRSGELYALKWSNIDINNDLIKIVSSYSTKVHKFLPTKNKLTRNIPINAHLKILLKKIKYNITNGEFVLPHPTAWAHGQQSAVLDKYAKSAGLPSVRFHDLRALAACQMHLSGTPMHLVKAILGWSDLAVVNRYLRISGAEVKGATKNFKIKMPTKGRNDP